MPQKIVGLLEIIKINEYQRAQRIFTAVFYGIVYELFRCALIIYTRQRILLRPKQKLHLPEFLVIDIDHTAHDTGHIAFCAQKGSQIGLIPCKIIVKSPDSEFDGIVLWRLKQALQYRLIISHILLENRRGIKARHISAVYLVFCHTIFIVITNNHNVRSGIIINNFLAFGL